MCFPTAVGETLVDEIHRLFELLAEFLLLLHFHVRQKEGSPCRYGMGEFLSILAVEEFPGPGTSQVL